MTGLQLTISCGERKTSTLNLAFVKEKGIHRASTDCPQNAWNLFRALRHSVVFSCAYVQPSRRRIPHADRSLRFRSVHERRERAGTASGAANAGSRASLDPGSWPHADARGMHRDRARSPAEDPGHARRLCRGALSSESGLRAPASADQRTGHRDELNLRSAKGFFDVGTRPKSDVARAEVDVANARVDLIRARNALRTAIVALNIAMAIDVDSPLQIVDNLIYQPGTLDRQALRADSLRQRPEYRQAKLRAAAAEATERQTFRNFFPDVTGTGAYGGALTPVN